MFAGGVAFGSFPGGVILESEDEVEDEDFALSVDGSRHNVSVPVYKPRIV